MVLVLAFALMSLPLLPGCNNGPDGPGDPAAQRRISDGVEAGRIMETISFLASPELRGRAAGSAEAETAADLLEEQFASLGLLPVEPLGLDELSQRFEVPSDRCFADIPEGQLVTCRNVLGMIPGTDEPDRLIVLTANYDGLGVDPESGAVYPGADFNASGTGGVLELARLFTELGLRPRKSVVFACLGAEECGSFGSRALADVIEQREMKDQVQAINLQGLGVGTRGYMDVWDLNYRKNRPIVQGLTDAAAFCEVDMELGGSDPGSPASLFFIYHIPAVNCDWSWTEENDHPDFHLAGDTADKIQELALRDSTRVVGVAAWLLAN
jgi:hypothetical protein